MITIFAVSCHLALLHVHCAPKSDQKREVEDWWLDEAIIKYESPHEPMEHYTNEVSFVRYDNDLWLDTPKEGADGDRKVFACFKTKELHAFLDNELYAVTEHPQRVIRMTIAYKSKAKRLKKFFVPTPFKHVNF